MTVDARPAKMNIAKKPSIEKEKWTEGFSPTEEAKCNLYLIGKKKMKNPFSPME